MAGRSRRNCPRMSLIHSSWAFSWSWHRSEAAEIMAGRFRSSFVIVVVAGIEAAIIWALGGWMIFGNLPGWGELAVVGAATFLIVAVVMGATEAHHWRTAAWRSWQTTPDWRGGAYVSPSTRRHGPMLMCVHAVPRNQGHGSQILTQVCQWADQQGLTLELKPSGSAAERFYKRFGFVKTSRRVMRRECLSGRADPHKGV